MILSKADYHEYLNQDAIALGIHLKGFKSRIKNYIFPNPIWKYQRIMRKLEFLSNTKKSTIHLLYYWYKWRFHQLSIKLGFSIPINTCGKGLSIAHYGPIIINSACRIGKNCRIHACVNIGASGGSKAAPQIGDNV